MQQRSCRRRVCCDYRAPLDSLFVCGVDIAVCAAPLACQGMPCRQRHWHTLSLTLLFAFTTALSHPRLCAVCSVDRTRLLCNEQKLQARRARVSMDAKTC